MEEVNEIGINKDLAVSRNELIKLESVKIKTDFPWICVAVVRGMSK